MSLLHWCPLVRCRRACRCELVWIRCGGDSDWRGQTYMHRHQLGPREKCVCVFLFYFILFFLWKPVRDKQCMPFSLQTVSAGPSSATRPRSETTGADQQFDLSESLALIRKIYRWDLNCTLNRGECLAQGHNIIMNWSGVRIQPPTLTTYSNLSHCGTHLLLIN